MLVEVHMYFNPRSEKNITTAERLCLTARRFTSVSYCTVDKFPATS